MRSFDSESGQLDEVQSFPISSGSADLEISGSNWSMTFSVNGDVSFYVRFFYDVNLFSKDYYEFSYWVQTSAMLNATFNASGSFENTITVVDSDFPVIAGLDIHFALSITFNVNASLIFSGNVVFLMKSGASRDSTGNQNNIEQEPKVDINFDVDGKFSINIIPQISTGFCVLKVFFCRFKCTGKP